MINIKPLEMEKRKKTEFAQTLISMGLGNQPLVIYRTAYMRMLIRSQNGLF